MTTTHSKNDSSGTPTHKVEAGMKERISEGIEGASHKIIDVVEEKSKALSDTSAKLMDEAQNTANYLRESKPKKLGADLLALIKRHPVVSLALGAGFGMMVSRRRRRR